MVNGQSKSPLLLLAAGGNSGMESAVAMAFGEGEGRRCLRWRRGKQSVAAAQRRNEEKELDMLCPFFL
jgi:hypothetical protein